MPPAKPKFMPEQPRYYTDVQLAARLGFSLNWLAKNRDKLEAEGMPKADPLFDNRVDSVALELWCSRRSKIVDHAAETEEDSDIAEQRVAGLGYGASHAG